MMQIIQSYFLFFTRCDVICDPLQYTRTGKCNLFVQHQILLTKQLFKHKDCFVFLHEIFWYFGNCVFFIPPRIILKWSLRMIRIVPRVRPHMSITTVLPNQTKNLHWSKTRLCSWHSYTYIYIYIYKYINVDLLEQYLRKCLCFAFHYRMVSVTSDVWHPVVIFEPCILYISAPKRALVAKLVTYRRWILGVKLWGNSATG